MLRLQPSSILPTQDEVDKVLLAPCPANPTIATPLLPAWDTAILARRSRLHNKGKSPAHLTSPPSSPPFTPRTLGIPVPHPSPASSLITPGPSSPIYNPTRPSRSPSPSYSHSDHLDGARSPHRFNAVYWNIYSDTPFSGATREPSEADYLADGEQDLSPASEPSGDGRLPPVPLLRLATALDGVMESDDGAGVDLMPARSPVLRLSTLRLAAIRNWAGTGAPVLVLDDEAEGMERIRVLGSERQEEMRDLGAPLQTAGWRRNLRAMEAARGDVVYDDAVSEDSLSGVVLPPDIAARMEERQRLLQVEAARRTIR